MPVGCCPYAAGLKEETVTSKEQLVELIAVSIHGRSVRYRIYAFLFNFPIEIVGNCCIYITGHAELFSLLSTWY